MTKRRYIRTDSEYREAVATSKSIAETARKLDLAPAGGNYETIKRKVEELNLNVDHFTGQGWKKGQFLSSHGSSQGVKQRLIRERGHCCENCSNDMWMGKPIPLELEHTDGNHSNNDDANILLLCPNCHAQTPTYRRAKSSLLGDPKSVRICPKCQQPKAYGSNQCIECHRKNPVHPRLAFHENQGTKNSKRPTLVCKCGNAMGGTSNQCIACQHNAQLRISWPSAAEVLEMVEVSSFSAVARKLGVSDNSVRKFLAKNGVDPKLVVTSKRKRA